MSEVKKTTIATSNNTVQINNISSKQKDLILGQVQDTNIFIPNVKLYPYSWFGISNGGASFQPATSTKTLTDFLRQVYTNNIILDQLTFLAGQSGGNKTYVELTISFSLSYALTGTKKYVDAMLLSSENNFFWNQAQSFAQYLNPKEYDFYIIQAEEFNNVNAMYFWSKNEDLLNTPLPAGTPIGSDKVIFVSDVLNQNTINPNGTFQYVIIGIKKVVPYITGEGESQKIWTEFYQNTPLLTDENKKIAYFDIEYEGPFALNRVFLFDNNFNLQYLDYQIIQGKPLRQISLFPKISLNKIRWGSQWVTDLKNAWLVSKYVKPLQALSGNIIKSSDGIINFPFTGLSSTGVTYDKVMKNESGQSSGVKTSLPFSIYNDGSVLDDITSSEMTSDGNATYYSINYFGTTGGGVGINDGLNIYNSGGYAASAIASFINPRGKNGLFGYEISNTNNLGTGALLGSSLDVAKKGLSISQKPSEEDKLKSQISLENLKQKADRLNIDYSSNLANLATVKSSAVGLGNFALSFIQLVLGTYAVSNVFSNNALPRNYQSKNPFWIANTQTPYAVDISAKTFMNIAGILKYNWLIFSAPVKRNKDFANKQKITNYWYDSEGEKYSNNGLLTGLINTNDRDWNKYIFPSYFSNYYQTDELTTPFEFIALIPFELEEVSDYFVNTNDYANKIISGNILYPTNPIFITPSFLMPKYSYRSLDNSLFFNRQFNSKDNVTNNKQIIRFFPVTDNVSNRKITISNITALSIADYGGWNRTIKFYDDTNTLLITQSTPAKNRTNPLASYSSIVFGSNLFQTIDISKEVIISSVSIIENDLVTISTTIAPNLTIEVVLDNPENYNIIFNSPSTTPTAPNPTITTIIPNQKYQVNWNGTLALGTTYDIVFDNIQYDTGAGLGTCENKEIVATTQALQVQIVSLTPQTITGSSITVRAVINKQGATIIDFGYGATGSDGTFANGNIVPINDTTYDITFSELNENIQFLISIWIYSNNGVQSVTVQEAINVITTPNDIGSTIFVAEVFTSISQSNVLNLNGQRAYIPYAVINNSTSFPDVFTQKSGIATFDINQATITQDIVTKLTELNTGTEVWVLEVQIKNSYSWSSGIGGSPFFGHELLTSTDGINYSPRQNWTRQFYNGGSFTPNVFLPESGYNTNQLTQAEAVLNFKLRVQFGIYSISTAFTSLYTRSNNVDYNWRIVLRRIA